jgi:N-acetylneuraminic acid mutarotase
MLDRKVARSVQAKKPVGNRFETSAQARMDRLFFPKSMVCFNECGVVVQEGFSKFISTRRFMKAGIPSGPESAWGFQGPRLRKAWMGTAISWIIALTLVEGAWEWEELGKTGGPDPRSHAVVVWTGRELLVWGGLPFGINTNWKNDGWRYDPKTDAWHAMTPVNAPAARQFPVGLWTGSELVIWGGHKTTNPPDSLKTGACYDPASDVWRTMNVTGAPAKRGDHTMVWTGTEVLIWGGYDSDGSNYLKSGGRYDPVNDSWSAMSELDAPAKRSRHSAVWTGSEMIIWGGGYLTSGLDWSHRGAFGSYDPDSNQWSNGLTDGAPSARSDHSAIWTGTEMIIWGGWSGNTFEEHRLQSGGSLDFATGTWTSLPLDGAPPARAGHCSVWTGREMIIWGGSVSGATQSGGRFNPSSAAWSAMPTEAAPSGGNRGACAWTGEAFYVFHDRLARACETGPYRLDGIPDDWQYQYFGEQNPDGAADQDPDADGQDNRMEFLARTVPTDPASRLVFTISWIEDSHELEFALFPGWPDRNYRLEWSSLETPIRWFQKEGAWVDQGNQPWKMRMPMTGSSRCFYRLAVDAK